MAVYYKWIKGCAVNSTLETGLWTYLKWGSGDVSTSVTNLPHIYTYKGKQDNPETENDLGYILTNKATDISLESNWKFNNNHSLSFYNNNSTPVEKAKFYSDTNTFYISTQDWIINNSSGSNEVIMHYYGGTTKKIEIGNTNYPTHILGTLKVNETTTLQNTIIENTTNATSATTGALVVTGGIGIGGAIYSGSSCTAEYFNATSDKRAKENIRPANYSALDLIKKLPVYIYNYKNTTETVTGILAQDLLEAQPEELDLVSNINATGKNNDYMSIKNDKLMFVLLKAIQEQQEQIEQLKSEIANIKKPY